MGREGEEFRVHRKEELTPDEGELARMEVADPATEDVVLPFKV